MHKNDNVNILKDLRARAGISQHQLARWTGVSFSLIQKLESGKRDFNKVSLETIFKFAVIFQVPMEIFVDSDNIEMDSPLYEEYHNYIMPDIRMCYDKKFKVQVKKLKQKESNSYEYIVWDMIDE